MSGGAGRLHRELVELAEYLEEQCEAAQAAHEFVGPCKSLDTEV